MDRLFGLDKQVQFSLSPLPLWERVGRFKETGRVRGIFAALHPSSEPSLALSPTFSHKGRRKTEN